MFKNTILLATWDEATDLATEYFQEEGIVYTDDNLFDMVMSFCDNNNIELIDM